MLKARISINHRGCWASEISTIFQKLQLFLTHCSSIHANTSTVLLHAYSNSSFDFRQLLEYIESKKRENSIKIISYNIIEKTQNSIIFQIQSHVRGSLVRRVHMHHCLITEPVILKQGLEIWTISSTNRKNIQKVLQEFSNQGQTNLLFIKKVGFEKLDLTDKQKQTLQAAFSLGYYAWPRKINLLGLAKAMQVSPSALRERLRKAELKLLATIIESV